MKVTIDGKELEVKVENVYNGKPILTLWDDEGPYAKLSKHYKDVKLKIGQMLVKDWAENEGLLEPLIKNGIVEKVGEKIYQGEVYPICEMTEKFHEEEVKAMDLF